MLEHLAMQQIKEGEKMASLSWYAFNNGSQYATVTVDYTENIYTNYNTITVNNIRYYNNYTSDANSSGAPIYWTGLTLQISGSFGTHTVVSGMHFGNGSNASNETGMNATTPNISTGTSVNFILSGTLTPRYDWGSLNREPLTIGSSQGSSETTQSISTHSHSWSSSVTKQPTCTATGVRTYTCSSCGNSYTESIAMIAHKWNSGLITINPTYETNGVKTYTCSACNGTKTESVAKLPPTIYIHNGNDWETYGIYIHNGSDWEAYAVYIDDGERFIAYC